MNNNAFWIRVHTSYLDDPVFIRLPNETKWHFFAMYLLAKKGDAGGLLAANNKTLSIDDISFLLHDDPEAISNSISLLLKNNFLILDGSDYAINDYEEDQKNTQKGNEADKIREQTRIRVQNHRERIKKQNQEKENKRIEKNREEGNALHSVTHQTEGNNGYSLPEGTYVEYATEDECDYSEPKVKEFAPKEYLLSLCGDEELKPFVESFIDELIKDEKATKENLDYLYLYYSNGYQFKPHDLDMVKDRIYDENELPF